MRDDGRRRDVFEIVVTVSSLAMASSVSTLLITGRVPSRGRLVGWYVGGSWSMAAVSLLCDRLDEGLRRVKVRASVRCAISVTSVE